MDSKNGNASRRVFRQCVVRRSLRIAPQICLGERGGEAVEANSPNTPPSTQSMAHNGLPQSGKFFATPRIVEVAGGYLVAETLFRRPLIQWIGAQVFGDQRIPAVTPQTNRGVARQKPYSRCQFLVPSLRRSVRHRSGKICHWSRNWPPRPICPVRKAR